MPSPYPEPTAVKKLKGNPGKRPLNKHEARPRAGSLHCPDHLDDRGREEWDRIVGIMSPTKDWLTDAEYVTLGVLCQQYSFWVEASEIVASEGFQVPTKTGFTRHPMLKVINDALTHMHRCCAELGLTPSARSRVKIAPKQAGDNPWNEILENPEANSASTGIQ